MTTPEQFKSFIDAVEGTHFEYKEAGSYHFDELVQYCVALANEGGGKILLGVTDRRPRQVLEQPHFPNPDEPRQEYFSAYTAALLSRILSNGLRVLIVHVPSRPVGSAWNDGGVFWMRAGDSLVGMTDEQLQLIHTEAVLTSPLRFVWPPECRILIRVPLRISGHCGRKRQASRASFHGLTNKLLLPPSLPWMARSALRH
jgi:predicted HTH transcriptional regulator